MLLFLTSIVFYLPIEIIQTLPTQGSFLVISMARSDDCARDGI